MSTVDQLLTARSRRQSRVWHWLRSNLGGLLLVALAFLFPYLFAWVRGGQVDDGLSRFWQGQLINVFIMAVYAISYDLLMGYTGILSFGHAAFFGGGAYAICIFLTHVAPKVSSTYRISLPGGANITEPLLMGAAILLVLVVSYGLGLIYSITSARVKGVYFAMITLAIAESIHIFSKATDFVRWTGADEGLHGVPVPAWINPTQFRLRFYFMALIFLVVMFLVLRRIIESPTGKVFIAISQNENRVKMIGFNPVVYRRRAFIISAIVAGLAGAMFGLWNLGATPSMTSALTTINALIITILGGIGTLFGPVLGAGLMQIFGQFFFQWFGPRWPLVFGVLFIALVVFLPYGIVGTWQMRRNALHQGWKRLVGLVIKN